ncbi:MAG TPA: phosphocholine cytidylyltransferase family protein [Isosphaeraceae bacterium]|jgi:2-aminoethylphosphonate-pyruvate transaminase|nr:phosphocholine cytidylyltransferase family protein [Isosphaeraceae bacterium]
MSSNRAQLRTAVILAAGLGSRIGHRSAVHPKAFIEVGGVTLIQRSLRILAAHGIEQIIIGTGHHAEWFDRLEGSHPGVRCVRNPDYARSASLHTLCQRALREAVGEDFLLLESDLIYEQRAVGALLDAPSADAVLVAGLTRLGDEVFVSAGGDGCLRGLFKDPARSQTAAGVLVGISRICLPTYRALCDCAARQKAQPSNLHYEEGLAEICGQVSIPLLRIADLVWAEIDTEEQLHHAVTRVYPLIQARDHCATP